MISFILKVLLLAIAFTFIYAWGYVKQQKKNEELLNALYKKAEAKILKELRKRKFLTKKDIENLIKGTKASLFWSRSKVQVVDAKLVAKDLIMKMTNEGLIVEMSNSKPKKYKLK
ncbi:hypothetical protein [Caloranaerobacter azorensis]|nr:hypothetical protein [Caloranaerobacter azorensis]